MIFVFLNKALNLILGLPSFSPKKKPVISWVTSNVTHHHIPGPGRQVIQGRQFLQRLLEAWSGQLRAASKQNWTDGGCGWEMFFGNENWQTNTGQKKTSDGIICV